MSKYDKSNPDYNDESEDEIYYHQAELSMELKREESINEDEETKEDLFETLSTILKPENQIKIKHYEKL